MLSNAGANAVLAVALGSVLAVLLFLPVAAAQYRIDGRLGPGDLATLVLGAIYALAIWTYTLLPFPSTDGYRCRGEQLRLLGSFETIHWPPGGAVAFLREPAFLQIVLNVLLFAPLGWLVRVVAHRGVLVATALGLAVSLLVETTQGTGVWHLYPCPYRLFDVDDLLVNTLGATLGSLASRPVVHRRRGTVVLPTAISLGRRLVGMASDVLFVGFAGAAVTLLLRGYAEVVPAYAGVAADPSAQAAAQWGLPLLLETGAVLGLGRTAGELVVSLHSRPRRSPQSRPGLLGRRAVKLAAGVGPVFALVLLPAGAAVAGLTAYAVATVAASALTPDRRGLSHVLAGLDLRIGDDSET